MNHDAFSHGLAEASKPLLEFVAAVTSMERAARGREDALFTTGVLLVTEMQAELVSWAADNGLID